MPLMTPEEFLEKHGHKYPETDPRCTDLCTRWYNDIENIGNLPDGPERTALEKQITALARQIKQLGCRCPPPQ